MTLVDYLIRRNTGFTGLDDMLSAGGNYRPSLDMREPWAREVARAYDEAQAKRGDARRAYRYGSPNLYSEKRGRVWANQGERKAHVLAVAGHLALIEYTMPNGRSYLWELDARTTWAELGAGCVNPRNVQSKRAPARWREALADYV